MSLRFTKMHGLGNDFVVLDRRDATAPLASAQVRRLADRHVGVGCDQVMTIERSRDVAATFGYGIYNADGSTAGQCGNGVRCVARWLQSRGLIGRGDVALFGPAGVVTVRVLDDDRVRVNMGEPRFEASAVPISAPTQSRYTVRIDDAEVNFGAVSMGNPHALIEVTDVASAPVMRVGSILSVHPLFPDRANVGFAQVLSRGAVRLRVHERGVGETLACGSGACAAVAVLRQWGRVDDRVRVSLPGGDLDIEWQGPGHPVWMTGPATRVFEGEWNDD